MSTDLNVNFLGIRMKTPIIAASGIFEANAVQYS